ncbi:MAG: glycosyltransferase family 2 protein [Muribaculaceae bacterium]|nr:glycosyltransferase family 2 protein [Muribaculaceae bacterium]
MDVSIIIVNYNTRDILRDCIWSIKSQSKDIEYEVIVVDNDSSDGTLEMLQREFPEVKAIDAGQNLGFGRANNLGMQQARGKYLFLLNSDTIIVNNAIKIFFDKAEHLMQEDGQIGVLGAILYGSDSKTCHSYGSFITPKMELKEVMAKYLRFLKDKKNTNPPSVETNLNVDYITGADMFVPAKVFKATGGFDPDFFMYCEEVDWQKRMDEKGYRRIIVNGPEIIHLEGGSDTNKKKSWSPNRLANLYKSRKIYREKHYNKVLLPFFRMLRLLLDMPSILILALATRRKEYLNLIKLG